MFAIAQGLLRTAFALRNILFGRLHKVRKCLPTGMCAIVQKARWEITTIRLAMGNSSTQTKEIKLRSHKMSLGMILLIVLVLALAGVIPTWGHSSSWGYGPSGGVGTLLVIVLILVLMGKI
jgi:hypothetical protein